jgi:hypothetical protein
VWVTPVRATHGRGARRCTRAAGVQAGPEGLPARASRALRARAHARASPYRARSSYAGQYNAHWADLHLGPEQAVLAHRLVRGDVMLPVHTVDERR